MLAGTFRPALAADELSSRREGRSRWIYGRACGPAVRTRMGKWAHRSTAALITYDAREARFALDGRCRVRGFGEFRRRARAGAVFPGRRGGPPGCGLCLRVPAAPRARRLRRARCGPAGVRGRAQRQGRAHGSARSVPGCGSLRPCSGYHADLLVGSARRALRGRLLRGGTADGVLRCGACPVAIASTGYRSRQHRFRTVGVIFDGTPPSRAAVRPAAIALAEDGVVRVYSTAGVLPEDDVQEVLAPLPGGVPVQAAAPVRVLTAGSGKIVDVVIAGAAGRFRLPGFGRRQAGRWIRARRCPVLVLPESQTAAGGRAPVADREEAT